MSKSLFWRTILVVFVILFGLYKVYPTIKWTTLSKERRKELTQHWEEETDKVIESRSLTKTIGLGLKKWYYGDEDRTLKLGLDLKGGIYFVVQVDESDKINGVEAILRERVNRTKVAEPIIQRGGKDKIIVQLPGYEDIEKAKKLVTEKAYMQWLLVDEKFMIEKFGGDEGNKRLIAMYNNAVEELDYEYRDEPEKWTFEILDEKLSEMLPQDRILRLLKSERTDPVTGQTTESTSPLLMRKQPIATGNHLKSAEPSVNPNTNEAVIAFVLKGAGADQFFEATNTYNAGKKGMVAANGGQGWRIAILLDDVVLSDPHIQSAIRSRGTISGNFTMQEARELSINLEAGSFDTGVKIVQNKFIGPTLGAISVQKGVSAALLGMAVVVLFMVGYYLKAGLISIFALVMNVLLLTGLLASLGATLTLPGIAGIILTIGMAVDANVLIFERMREETGAAKKIFAAIDSGYHKAFRTILDANITTLITAIVLYIFGKGPVQGFAVTLSLGILTSMFTSVFVTRVVFDLLALKKSFTRVKMNQFFTQPKIDFVAKRKNAITVSVVLIVLGLISFVAGMDENFGIDFTGGNQTIINSTKDMDSEAVRDYVRDELGIDAEIRHFGSKKELMINTRKGTSTELASGIDTIFSARSEAFRKSDIKEDKLYLAFREDVDVEEVEKIITESNIPAEEVRYGESRKEIVADYTGAVASNVAPLIAEKFPEYGIDLKAVSTSEVGPAVGEKLRQQAIIAVVLAMIGMILYISWRFEFRFAIAAIAAISHDVLITIGFFSGVLILTRRQIDLPIVAALLTIIGYSLNDTIVVFDRIREDLKIMKRIDFKTIVNTSINQTLSRTALTSVTTLLVIISLLIFGGARINDFAFALLVGVIAGTYSSIFIASPLLVWMNKEK
jgi:protein-export membrane protein SecD/preprotein translocase SecF subunit